MSPLWNPDYFLDLVLHAYQEIRQTSFFDGQPFLFWGLWSLFIVNLILFVWSMIMKKDVTVSIYGYVGMVLFLIPSAWIGQIHYDRIQEEKLQLWKHHQVHNFIQLTAMNLTVESIYCGYQGKGKKAQFMTDIDDLMPLTVEVIENEVSYLLEGKMKVGTTSHVAQPYIRVAKLPLPLANLLLMEKVEYVEPHLYIPNTETFPCEP